MVRSRIHFLAMIAVAVTVSGCDASERTAYQEEVALQFIASAWSGEFDDALDLATDDLVVAGCDVNQAWAAWTYPGSSVSSACPENGSSLAMSGLLGYFAFLSELDTQWISADCTDEGEAFFLEELLDPVTCQLVATNRLLEPTGRTYAVQFVFDFDSARISAIEEIGHPTATVENNHFRSSDLVPDPPPDVLVDACDGDVAVVDNYWNVFEPGIATDSREWWVSLGEQCGAAFLDLVPS